MVAAECHRRLGVEPTFGQDSNMGLNGNRFKLSRYSQPCPASLGYPPLVPRDGRLVPTCERCGGSGNVPRQGHQKAAPEGGSPELRDKR